MTAPSAWERRGEPATPANGALGAGAGTNPALVWLVVAGVVVVDAPPDPERLAAGTRRGGAVGGLGLVAVERFVETGAAALIRAGPVSELAVVRVVLPRIGVNERRHL